MTAAASASRDVPDARSMAVARRGCVGSLAMGRPRGVRTYRLSAVFSRASRKTKVSYDFCRAASSGGSTNGISQISAGLVQPQSDSNKSVGRRSVLEISGGDCSRNRWSYSDSE